MGKAIFITSCGTEIGKTYVTCQLIRALKNAETSVHALKPVISGLQGVAAEETDTGRLLKALGQPVTPKNMEAISPWQFNAPLTPLMAAAAEGKSLDAQEITDWCVREINKRPDYITLIEGAGGVMAPLTDTQLMRDWARALKVPAILVVGSYLGSLSHTFTAIEALKTHAKITAVIVNEVGSPPMKLPQTIETLRRFIPAETPVIALPYGGEMMAADMQLLLDEMAT